MFVFYLVSQPFVRIHLCTRTGLCVCVFVRVYCYRESWSEFQLKGECFQVRKKKHYSRVRAKKSCVHKRLVL